MRKSLFLIAVLALLILLTTSAVLADETDIDNDYPWRAHEAPYDFYFKNMIDTHQQSFQLKKEALQGFIYIHVIDIAEDGIPIAEKANCEAYPDECVVGWVIKGVPVTATLVNKGPRIWLIDPAEFDLPKEPGYTHFHWLGSPPYKPHGLEIGQEYSGYLLKRVAATTFYWLGGNGQGGSGGEGETGGCGSCSGEDHTGEEGGCSGGGGDMGDGCSGEDHTGEEGGCSGGGGDMGGGNPGHGGRLVLEGLDSHSNIITSPDEPWHGGCDD